MKIISTCRMGPGTFDAKFKPIEQLSIVNEIIVVRKTKIEGYKKLTFKTLPGITKFSLLNFLITPFILTYHTIRTKANLILAYHFIPHAFFAYFASFFTRKPFIIGQTGLFIQKYAQKPLIGNFICYIASKALYINVPGSKSKKFWISKGIDSNKINILHSTIDTNIFVNKGLDKKYDFIFLGRIAKEKQVHLIIKALKELHDLGLNVSMVFVGDGNYKIEAEKLVNQLGLMSHVDFVGFQQDVTEWLNKAKIFVMSSLSEGLPTALMQAMACELVCISSNVGNISDLLKNDYNGYIYDLHGSILLSKLMEMALNNFDESVIIRKMARKTVVENHSYKSAINKWGELLKLQYS